MGRQRAVKLIGALKVVALRAANVALSQPSFQDPRRPNDVVDLVFHSGSDYVVGIRFSRHGSRPVRRLLGPSDIRNVLDRSSMLLAGT